MVLSKIKNKIFDYGTLVMFSHTIFSLSFALISMLLAGDGRLNFTKIFWIVVAFLGARTGANALNRVIDAEIDKKNPRTSTRQIPQGVMNKKEVLIFVVICFGVMVFAAWKLNTICLILSPIDLFIYKKIYVGMSFSSWNNISSSACWSLDCGNRKNINTSISNGGS